MSSSSPSTGRGISHVRERLCLEMEMAAALVADGWCGHPDPLTMADVEAMAAVLVPVVAAAQAAALRDAAESWIDEGNAVMFNKAGDDLSPEGRVGKWLRDRAAAIDAAHADNQEEA